MFQSATFKLTAWYLAIIVAISLLFSIVIYAIASSELDARIGYFGTPRTGFVINQPRFNSLRDAQLHEAEGNLIASLVITNACIWIAGGIGSYYLAKRTLRPIEEAHEAQSRFTSDASHELRTPLASMRTELEVALRDPKLSKPEMRELLASNLEEVNKLSKLSTTLLQLSRMDHDNIVKETIPLDEITRSVAKRFDKSEREIQITGTPYQVTANRSSLEELLTILLDNALKYSPKHTPVVIKFIGQKHLAGFAVSNQGEGISADALPHIFDRFYRIDTSRTGGEKKGYGLGLALAKKIVELHDGELSVSSAPGKVTTFRVLLPNISKSKAKNQ